MKFCIIDGSNPLGRNDYYYNFKDYNNWGDGKWRSWHSFAAIFETEFIPFEIKEKALQYDCILILGNTDFKALIPFVEKLKILKKKVAFGLHEGFTAFYTMNPGEWEYLKQLINKVDFYWNLNPSTETIFTGMFPNVKIKNIATAYPFDKWNFDFKPEKKEGILIATRTLAQHFHKRNSFFAIASALEATKYKVPITYVNEDGTYVKEKLIQLFTTDKLNIIERKNNYLEWLELISQHEMVYQLDMSYTHGQVVCDALFTNTPIIGGNNDNQQFSTYVSDFMSFDGCNSILTSYYQLDYFKKSFITQMEYQKDLLAENLSFDVIKYDIIKAFDEI